MHTKDRIKLLNAGFTLYRCSMRELVVKKQSYAGQGWKVESQHTTKRAVERRIQELLDDPKAIQI